MVKGASGWYIWKKRPAAESGGEGCATALIPPATTDLWRRQIMETMGRGLMETEVILTAKEEEIRRREAKFVTRC